MYRKATSLTKIKLKKNFMRKMEFNGSRVVTLVKLMQMEFSGIESPLFTPE